MHKFAFILPAAMMIVASVGAPAVMADHDRDFEFNNWARANPGWVRSHSDRYQFFLSHPGQASKFRNEWYGWRGNQGNDFNDWIRTHQDWKRDHGDRYREFMAHPDRANQFRNEWTNWRGADYDRHRDHDHDHDHDHDGHWDHHH